MPKRKAYEDIALLPNLIAETVCGEVYTGQEIGDKLRPGPAQIAKIETKRQAMTQEQIVEFATLCDQRCQHAYEKNLDWFMKCVRAKGNWGRDQMYVYLRHWLASYLTNPAQFRERVKTPA